MTTLSWRVDADGMTFEAPGAGSPTQWARSSLVTSFGRAAQVGPLLGLLEDDLARIDGDSLILEHRGMAALPPDALSGAGLPARLRHRLSIPAMRLGIEDSEFRFAYHFVDARGKRASDANRIGAVISIEGEQYTLPSSIFGLVEGIDTFNAAPPSSLDDRFRAWARLQPLLPEDAVVDEYLKGMHIAVPSSFTIRPFVNDHGEADLEPELLHEVRAANDVLSQGAKLDALPVARQHDFQRYFRRFRGEARSRYPADRGWYVVLEEPLRRALNVVKKAQRSAPVERRKFIERPHAYLREALEETGDEELLSHVFFDEGYSERVRGVGIWMPRVVPWVDLAKEPWLPPERIGLVIDDRPVEISAEGAPLLKKAIEDAIDAGQEAVEHNGVELPANLETLSALDEIIKKVEPAADDRSAREDLGKRVLLIKDHFEELEFVPQTAPRAGEVGGIPSTLVSKLYPHQQTALEWLQQHWVSGSTGALLADDMGLGKTLESLAFLGWLRDLIHSEVVPRRPMLLVAPTGLLRNWLDEHDRHLAEPGVGHIVRAYGAGLRELKTARLPRGKELQSGVPTLDVGSLERADAVLTTYETLRDYQHSFGRVEWTAAVFDEAQKIKNPAAAMTDAAKAMNIDFCIAMTGTPVENRLVDLWSIVDRVQPGRLGPLSEFSRRYEAASDETEATADLKKRLLVDAQPKVMLRRLKEDHLDGLPAIEVEPIRREMPASQAEAYNDVVEGARGARKGAMLEALGRLRSVSLHPTGTREGSDQEFIDASARLGVCFETLDSIAERNEKALIFLESREIQVALLEIIQRRYELASPPLLINGSVSGDRRKARVDEFQGRPGFDVMILSPKAGGVGLTLTAANHVIHLSRWWNPAVEDQCTDRVYRIGQDKPVTVYLPLAIHPDHDDFSFDRRLDKLLDRKRQLSRSVLAPPAMSATEAEALFNEVVR